MWTKQEIDLLIELFPNDYNINIAKKLNKTKSAIINQASRLGLKKSPKLLDKRNNSGNVARINNGGRNLTYESLKKIASNFKTRIDFIKGDGPAYNSARLKGYLDEICSHMTVMKFSIPQLILREITDTILNTKASYNNRKVIKPYEIDVYYEEFSLGFEYQGIAWHLNNKNDIIKSEMIKEKNINVFYIYEYNDSRNYEKDIKDQLMKNIILINSITNKKISKNTILNCKVKNIYLELYNKEELIQIAKKYDDFNEFKTNEFSIYRKLCKMKLISEATEHMSNKKIAKHNFSDEYIISIINKYDNLTDFRTNEMTIYKHIKRKSKDYLLNGLKRKPSYTIEEIKNKINQYKTKTDFIKNNQKMYKYIRVNKLTKTIFK